MRNLRPSFVNLFCALWYRDFPIPVAGHGQHERATWTTHIGICVRSVADLLGYFTHFEQGKRTDAVITESDGKTVIAHVEWEWIQPFRESFNELQKLRDRRHTGELSVLITYSRDDHHQMNMARIHEEWQSCTEPLIVFLVRFNFGKRQFTDLETYLVRNGKSKLIRTQPAYPWRVTGTRWEGPRDA